MRNVGLKEAQAGIKIAGINISYQLPNAQLLSPAGTTNPVGQLLSLHRSQGEPGAPTKIPPAATKTRGSQK